MTLRERKEQIENKREEYKQFVNSEDFSEEKAEKMETDIENMKNQYERIKQVEGEKAEAMNSQEDTEKYIDTNTSDTFRFTEALNFLDNPMNVKSEKRDFYSDVNQTGKNKAKASGVSLQGGNSLVITADQFKNAVDVSTEGDDLLFDEQGGFISALRDKMVLAELGVRYMSNLSNDVRFPKQTKTSVMTWEGETTSGSLQDTEYGSVSLSPKRGYVGVPVSNQMLNQNSMGIEQMIQDDIFNAVANGIEDAVITAGGSNEPQGIMDVASEVTVTSGSIYDHAVELESEVTGKNVRGEFAYMLDTGLRADAKRDFKDSGSGLTTWETDNTINGYRTGVTQSSPADQLIFGDFSSLIIGDFSGVEILKNPYVQAHAGITVYQVNVYVGSCIRYTESFAYSDLS